MNEKKQNKQTVLHKHKGTRNCMKYNEVATEENTFSCKDVDYNVKKNLKKKKKLLTLADNTYAYAFLYTTELAIKSNNKKLIQNLDYQSSTMGSDSFGRYFELKLSCEI